MRGAHTPGWTGDEGRAGPRFVHCELQCYLDCGILAFGFARVHCSSCGKEEVVAFSCKGRGSCPSCCARRLADSAAHLCDEVLPQVPVRQWVLSLPFRIRYLLACDARLCPAVRRILVRTLLDSLDERAASAGIPVRRSGAVVLAQRFGPPVFHETPSLTDEDVLAVNRLLHRRILRFLRRRGRLPRDEHDEPLEAEPDAHELGRVDEAGVRDRRAALSALRRPAQADRIPHRRPGRAQDSRSPLPSSGKWRIGGRHGRRTGERTLERARSEMEYNPGARAGAILFRSAEEPPMTTDRVRLSPILLPLVLLCSCSAPQSAAPSAAFPAGSEQAVRAVRAALPDAQLQEVARSKHFGEDDGQGAPLLWSVKLRSHDVQRTVEVTPQGAILFLSLPVAEQDLPSAVRAAASKETAGAKVLRREKQEVQATLRYASLDKPETAYVARLSKDGAQKRLELGADGKLRSSMDLGHAAEAGEKGEQEKEEAPPAQPADFKEPTVEPAAERAVAAVRAILPKMVFRGTEIVGYLDPMSEMEVLNYEVEFFQDGEAKEWNATPDGIVIQVPAPVALEAASPAVRETLGKQAGWKVERLVREETRAGLRFVALPKPKLAYLVEIEKDGKPLKLRFKPDGTRIEEQDPQQLLGK